jgi:hypothetical protein
VISRLLEKNYLRMFFFKMHNKKIIYFWMYIVAMCNNTSAQDSIPDTGISGVFEVVMATDRPDYYIRYFSELGFHVIDSGHLTKEEALMMYGMSSALKSYRLQNGQVDSHGMLRIWCWEQPKGKGIGYAMPETIGMRMSVMLTNDVIRLTDVFTMLRNAGEKYLVSEPVFDDPLGVSKSMSADFFQRPIGVREAVVYGADFNHVFFQRYGYTVPGYGTVADSTHLATSEFTHHDFIIKLDSMEQLMYLQTALGLKAEGPVTIDGDWQKGPKATFMMTPGYTHFYQGFVSPNNICGKLKFFMPRGPKPDLSKHQQLGEMGTTMHSFYTSKIAKIHDLVYKHGLQLTSFYKNEFDEKCFHFTGPEGATWQIIEKMSQPQIQPQTKLSIKFVPN